MEIVLYVLVCWFLIGYWCAGWAGLNRALPVVAVVLLGPLAVILGIYFSAMPKCPICREPMAAADRFCRACRAVRIE